MQAEVAGVGEIGTKVYSCEFDGSWCMNDRFEHEMVYHLATYVNGQVHTNGMENFWSLLKRGLHGTYVAVEPFHMFHYVDEQAFCFNNRETDDMHRFVIGMRQIVGRRLTYAEPTGEE